MNIVFLCTGNTCRSPMAEGYLKSKNIPDVSVISCGFSEGEPANPNAIAVMKEAGIDISNHISHTITEKIAEKADAIICMTESHKNILIQMGVDKKIISVLAGGIPDPFGGDLEIYRKCRDLIFASIDKLISNGFFNEIYIKIADSSDIGDISNIEKSVFTDPWSEKSIRESMLAGTKFFTAVYKGKIVGYMGLSEISGEGYVTNIAVLKNFRRKGIATALLQYVIKSEKNLLEFISLEVRISNKNAISLYEKLGFENAGIRKRFYTNPIEDALIMTKNFSTHSK